MKYYITFRQQGLLWDTLWRAIVNLEWKETLEDCIYKLEANHNAIIINVIKI